VVSRGYRGKAEQGGAVVGDGREIFLDPEAAGDEPYMLAACLPGIPVIVGRDRYRAGRTAVETFDAQVVVLDDAFQHLRLKRDLDIVLLDEARPLGNGRLLPRGPLREPPQALERADAIVLTRSRRWAEAPAALPGGVTGRPLFRCAHVPVGCWADRGGKMLLPTEVPRALTRRPAMLEGRRAFAFAGLADNRRFFESLHPMGATVVQSLGFPDHHRYAASDLSRICRRAAALGAGAVVTTYKDYVKVAGRCAWPSQLAVFDIRIDFGSDASGFEALVRNAIET
jgi:tetraacyldisaccharide 4'-kinase